MWYHPHWLWWLCTAPLVEVARHTTRSGALFHSLLLLLVFFLQPTTRTPHPPLLLSFSFFLPGPSLASYASTLVGGVSFPFGLTHFRGDDKFPVCACRVVQVYHR